MSTAGEQVERRGPFASVVRNRQFARVLVSDAISGAGDVLYWVALIVLLLEHDPDGALVAAAVVVRLVPRVAFGALAGVVADRYDRRRLLLVLDGSRAAAMFALAALAAVDGPPVAVLLVVFATCAASTPYRPALSAGYPMLLPEGQLAAANALSSTIGQVSSLTGPLLGALILLVGDPSVAFAVNGATFVVSVLLLSGITGLGGGRSGDGDGSASHRRRSVLGELAEGVREVRGSTAVSALIVLVAAVMLLRGLELVLHVQVSEGLLGLGPSGYGIISAALGAGALAAAPITGRMAGARRPGSVLIGSVLVGCVPFALLSVTDNLPLALAALAVQGGSIVCFEVVALTMLQRVCPSAVLGRVLGMQNTLSGSAKLVGSVVAPVLVAGAGLSVALFASAAGIAAIALALSPRIQRAARAASTVRVALDPFVEVLDRLRVFDGAARTAIERLAMHVTVEQVPAGTVVLREGEVADDFFVVVSGDFAVSTLGVEINRLGADDWFGEIGLLRRARRTATVAAVVPSVVWRIPGEVFLAAVTSSNGLSDELTEDVARRLERSDAVTGSDAAQR